MNECVGLVMMNQGIWKGEERKKTLCCAKKFVQERASRSDASAGISRGRNVDGAGMNDSCTDLQVFSSLLQASRVRITIEHRSWSGDDIRAEKAQKMRIEKLWRETTTLLRCINGLPQDQIVLCSPFSSQHDFRCCHCAPLHANDCCTPIGYRPTDQAPTHC